MSFGKNKADVELFRALILKNLNKHAISDQYQVCREEDMFGLYVLLIAKKSVQTRIFDIASCQIKTGFGNTTGNKGAVCMRF